MCERQPNGKCDFTPSSELARCLADEKSKSSKGTDVQ
jgi:hypothetical protein